MIQSCELCSQRGDDPYPLHSWHDLAADHPCTCQSLAQRHMKSWWEPQLAHWLSFAHPCVVVVVLGSQPRVVSSIPTWCDLELVTLSESTVALSVTTHTSSLYKSTIALSVTIQTSSLYKSTESTVALSITIDTSSLYKSTESTVALSPYTPVLSTNLPNLL